MCCNFMNWFIAIFDFVSSYVEVKIPASDFLCSCEERSENTIENLLTKMSKENMY